MGVHIPILPRGGVAIEGQGGVRPPGIVGGVRPRGGGGGAGSGRRGSWGGEKTYILQGPAFGTFIQLLTGDRSRPTPVRVAIKSDHDILP